VPTLAIILVVLGDDKPIGADVGIGVGTGVGLLVVCALVGEFVRLAVVGDGVGGGGVIMVGARVVGVLVGGGGVFIVGGGVGGIVFAGVGGMLAVGAGVD
jgi:hypothetical protein